MLDLKSGEITREFDLASAGKNTHVNAACILKCNINYGKKCPLVIVTECKDKYRCFVEELNDTASTLIQTIDAVVNGQRQKVLIWVLDNQNHRLYAVTRSGKHLDEKEAVCNTITQYRLPCLKEGKCVTLKDCDVVTQFEVIFPNILQGAKISRGKLFIVTGLQQSLNYRKDSGRAIHVIDLKKKKLKYTIDLSSLTTNEPEDMDFYKGRLLLYCGQEGGIYEIK